MAHPPFLPPLLSTPDPDAWQGGAGSMPRAMLSAEATTPLAVRWVAPLLGRIAWDACYGEEGRAYCSDDKPSVLRMGHDIIEAWFCA
jgi:hypothetical protein